MTFAVTKSVKGEHRKLRSRTEEMLSVLEGRLLYRAMKLQLNKENS